MNSAAASSFTGLVVIQVTIGLVYSLAGHSGSYAFSQASALTIAEALKFLISSGLFLTESRSNYDALPKTETEHNDVSGAHERPSIVGVLRRANQEVPHTMKIGFAVLACLYAINNHLSFLLFLLCDPGTISLVKSGSTFTTALVLLVITGQNQARKQWFAILLQVVGLVVTQTDFSSILSNNPGKEIQSLYSLSSYALLFSSAAITAISSVANERLCKAKMQNRKISLNAQNMFLYSAGALLNLAIYMMKYKTRANGIQEPGFFSGYNTFAAVMVVISNTVIGLAITAVYKYANAVIKCLAMAFATGILLVLSSVFFGATTTLATWPGTVLIFLGTYLYVTYVPIKGATTTDAAPAPVDTNRTQQTRPSRMVLIFLVAFLSTMLTVYYFSYLEGVTRSATAIASMTSTSA